MIKNTKPLAPLMVLIALSLSTASSASMADDQEGAQVNSVSTTLLQAVSIAEQATSSQAFEAELERENGIWVYDIETTRTDGRQYEVRIDANNGEVIRKRLEDDYDDELRLNQVFRLIFSILAW